MSSYEDFQIEELRKALLEEIYAGAFAGGFPSMLTEEDEIRSADPAELEEIARKHGLR